MTWTWFFEANKTFSLQDWSALGGVLGLSLRVNAMNFHKHKVQCSYDVQKRFCCKI